MLDPVIKGMRSLALVGYILFFLFGLWAITSFLTYSERVYNETLLPRAAAAPIPINAFDGVGAVTFYRQTDGPKPWLVYVTEGGRVAIKSLTCGACPKSAAAFEAAYGGDQVHVEGIRIDEHIEVTALSRAAPGDDRIQFFDPKMGDTGDAAGVAITPRIGNGDSSDALLWANVSHDGITEEMFFKQGTLLTIGARTVTLLYARVGAYHFAVIAAR